MTLQTNESLRWNERRNVRVDEVAKSRRSKQHAMHGSSVLPGHTWQDDVALCDARPTAWSPGGFRSLRRKQVCSVDELLEGRRSTPHSFEEEMCVPFSVDAIAPPFHTRLTSARQTRGQDHVFKIVCVRDCLFQRSVSKR